MNRERDGLLIGVGLLTVVVPTLLLFLAVTYLFVFTLAAGIAAVMLGLKRPSKMRTRIGLSLCVLTVFGSFGLMAWAGRSGHPIKLVIPNDYTGTINIHLDEENGVAPIKTDDYWIYKIGDDGSLITSNDRPFQQWHKLHVEFRDGRRIPWHHTDDSLGYVLESGGLSISHEGDVEKKTYYWELKSLGMSEEEAVAYLEGRGHAAVPQKSGGFYVTLNADQEPYGVVEEDVLALNPIDKLVGIRTIAGIEPEVFAKMRVFPNLKQFAVHYEMPNESLPYLSRFPNVEELTFWGDDYGNFETFPKLDQLRLFDHEATRGEFTVETARRLASCRNLEEVTITRDIPQEGIDLLKELPKLKYMEINQKVIVDLSAGAVGKNKTFLDNITIPVAHFEDDNLLRCLGMLWSRTIELDAYHHHYEDKGLSFLVRYPTVDAYLDRRVKQLRPMKDEEEVKVNFKARNLSLGEVLTEVAKSAGFDLHITPAGAIFCAPGKEPFPNEYIARGHVWETLYRVDADKEK